MLDYYGKPIEMNFDKKQSHQTVFGGMVTLAVVYIFLTRFVKSMLAPEDFYLKDNISSFSVRSGSSDPPPAQSLFKNG
jgi:hypothetical protein